MRIFLLFAFVFSAALTDDDLRRFFLKALRKANCEEKEAYTDMGISQSQFSKQMNGIEPPRFLSRIWKIQNREVAKIYFFDVSAHVGTPAHIKRSWPVVLGHLAHRHLLRTSLQQQRKVRAS